MINIIIPCYKCENTLPLTLNSLVAQTNKKFIITLIQDGPETNIEEIVNNYKDKLNINFIKLKENVGPGLARQEGINKNILCEYLLFLDSDDMLLPYAIEILNRESQLNKPDILISQFINHNLYGITKIMDISKANTWLHGKLYRAEFLLNNNICFSSKIKYNEDACFNLKALNSTNNIKVIELPTLLWIDCKNSITRSDNNFEINSIPDFIIGQIEATLFLLDKNNCSVKLLAKNINNIYNQYQKYIFYTNKKEESVEKELKEFLTRTQIKEILNNKVFKKLLLYYNHKEKIEKFTCEEETIFCFIRRFVPEFKIEKQEVII